mmetsp:Transcript_3357/g.7696  ORF Transcript_3357/g.7696 Transcript_3357/m.7696 type:complete len:496 (+) Transcript_3357:78-1565(+)
MDYDDQEIGDLVRYVQSSIFPRRVRLREFFVDFDPLRSGRCTAPHFQRALDMANVRLSEEDIERLVRHFVDNGPRVQKPQNVNYVRFCEAINEVFNHGDPNPRMTSSPSTTQMMTFHRNPVHNEEHLMHLLHRVAMLCKSRGVVLKSCFTDHDRAAIASPSRMNPKTGGKVTKSQFIRNFPFRRDITEDDLDLLAERYRVGGPECTATGDVHFMALHNDVTEALNHEMPPFPRSDLYLKSDGTEWSHHRLHPVEKLQSKVVEKRLRLYEHFQDFDALRKGVCTVGQVKTVFTMMGLSGKDLDKVDFDTITSAYMRDDGMFRYKEFCEDIDRGFTVPNLEKDPLAVISMPDASSTAPGRRNRITMTPTRMGKIQQLEDKMRSRVKKRGIYLKPMFQDMDRTNQGHVSRSQFARVMCMLGFELDEVAIGLLCSVYCDLGNHNDFNYVDFLKAVDPPNEDTELAMEQATAPYQDHLSSKYFDARGTVRPLDRMSPLLA